MNLFKILMLTTAIIIPLSVYVSTLIAQPVETQTDTQTVSSVKSENKLTAAQQSNELPTLKANVIALKAELAALREEMHTMAKTKAATAILGRDTNKDVPRSDEELHAEETKHFAAQSEALESDFRQQTLAPTWATDTMALIRTALASDKSSDSAIIDLQCRSRTCRLELANNGKNQALELVEFTQTIAEELSNVIVSQAESSDSTTVFYLSKEEFVLPD
jgi:hypothetical protein